MGDEASCSDLCCRAPRQAPQAAPRRSSTLRPESPTGTLRLVMMRGMSGLGSPARIGTGPISFCVVDGKEPIGLAPQLCHWSRRQRLLYCLA